MPASKITVSVKLDTTVSPPACVYSGGNGPNPGDVSIDGANSTIEFKRDQSGANFAFSGCTITPTPGWTPTQNDFTTSVDTQNNKITITDSDVDKGTYNYALSLRLQNGQIIVDPQIINKT